MSLISDKLSFEVDRLRLISDNTTNIIIFSDVEGRITWVNKTFTKVTGYTMPESEGKKPGDLLQGEETSEDTILFMRQKIAEQVRFKTDVINYTKQGAKYWVEIEIIPLKNAEGDLEGFMSVQSDISPVKTIIGEMLSAKGILKTVLDTTPLYVSVKDKKGRFIFYNKRYHQEFARAEGYFDLQKHVKLEKHEKQIFETGEKIFYEDTLTVNGKEHQFLIITFPLKDSGGDIYALGRLAIDISEKKKAQDILRGQEQLYYSTVQSINDAVITIDKNFKILYLNPSAEQLTGYSLSDAVDHEYYHIIKIKELHSEAAVNILHNPLYKDGDLREGKYRLISRFGDETPIGDESLTQMIDSDGQFRGIVLFFKDISDKVERERLEKEIEISRIAALIEGQEVERKRIARELHDGLGQMLNLVKMKVFLAQETVNDSLNKLIDEAIQETTRISNDLTPSKLRDFDLATGINSLVRQLNNIYDVQITFYSWVRSSIGESKKVNMYRVAQEAINNALKHAKASFISVSLIEHGDRISLTVEDNGAGMQKEDEIYLDALRIKPDVIHHGLQNMQQRAKIMGGHFSIESGAGLGTLIIVDIPNDEI